MSSRAVKFQAYEMARLRTHYIHFKVNSKNYICLCC